MKLTADLIESLSGVYLSQRYDEPQPTPDFHRECWTRYCSDAPNAATAAPRNHAKSTALTHDYGLAAALFRDECYIILVGSSEEMAIEHLGDIATELRDNEDLRRDFLIKEFAVDQKTDIVVTCTDGYQFRFIARGAEQKIRGRKWNGRRPGLVLCDDLEDDEQVENRDRRAKFRKWFFRACKQALRDGGKIRVHGTILHEDSLLNHLMKNSEWSSRCYKAHHSFSDFTNILWPEKFPEVRLRSIQREFIREGDSAGYSQEYLNDPYDSDEAFLRKEQFVSMTPEDRELFKIYAVGVDFAVSKADAANRTSFTIGGKDTGNVLHVVDQRCGRWDTTEIIEEFFSIQSAWGVDVFFVEDGVIWKAMEPIINREMLNRDIWLSFQKMKPVTDKRTRGRSLQKRMKARGMRFDKEASWYPDYEQELLRFTGLTEATLDDQFDSSTWLSRGFEDYKLEIDEEDMLTEEEIEQARQADTARKGDGRSAVTGY